MKTDFFHFSLKLGCLAAMVALTMQWGVDWVLYAGIAVVLLWLCLWGWKGLLLVRHAVSYARPLKLFSDALNRWDMATFDQLLHQYMPAWRRGDKAQLCEDVFLAVVRADSPVAMKLMLRQESAPRWQEMLINPLCCVVLHGSTEMLNLLIEQGMSPAQEWESPWLIALINARVDHARVLALHGHDVMTSEQQNRSAWPPLDDILAIPDFFPTPEQKAAVVDYLKERGKVCSVRHESRNV